jgi:hypothetical protein
MQAAIAAPAPPTSPTQLVTVIRVCHQLDAEVIPVAIVFDKAYHIREDLQHPQHPFGLPIRYWTLISRKKATANLTNVPSGLASGHGLYIANGIVEDLDELHHNANTLKDMLQILKTTLEGVVREGFLIKFKVINALADDNYLHSLIALQEYDLKHFHTSVVSQTALAAAPALIGGLTVLEEEM